MIEDRPVLENWTQIGKGHFVLARNVDGQPALAQVIGKRGTWRWAISIRTAENTWTGDESTQRRALEIAQGQLKARIQEFKFARAA